MGSILWKHMCKGFDTKRPGDLATGLHAGSCSPGSLAWRSGGVSRKKPFSCGLNVYVVYVSFLPGGYLGEARPGLLRKGAGNVDPAVAK